MCEEFAKICGGGSHSRFIFSERRSDRCEANANQVLLYPFFFFVLFCFETLCFLLFLFFLVLIGFVAIIF
jgi:hypothetical protein